MCPATQGDMAYHLCLVPVLNITDTTVRSTIGGWRIFYFIAYRCYTQQHLVVYHLVAILSKGDIADTISIVHAGTSHRSFRISEKKHWDARWWWKAKQVDTSIFRNVRYNLQPHPDFVGTCVYNIYIDHVSVQDVFVSVWCIIRF